MQMISWNRELSIIHQNLRQNESTCVLTGRNEVDLRVEVRLGQEEKGVGLGAPRDTLICREEHSQGKPGLNHLVGPESPLLSGSKV